MKKRFLFLFAVFITQSVCADFITQNTINGCDDGFINIDNNDHSNMFAVFIPNQHTCSNGYYLPANTDDCQICTYGHSCLGGTYTFNEIKDQGISAGSYTCNSGYFLPSNSDTCRVCPINGTCPGGTYTFNETVSQGIDFSFPFTQSQINSCVTDLAGIDSNNHSNIIAIFTPNVHTCLPGYYLPANIDGCTICPVNHICSGGTYTFNETIDKGIEQCSDDTPYSPMGSVDLCYPHVLHIGEDIVYLKSDKLTTPSLNIGMDDGIFYANMTTVPTPMNAGTDHVLKIEYDGVVYYVCDDTTYMK